MTRAAIILVLSIAPAVAQKTALIQDRTHDSYVFSETRNYRIFLPAGYAESSQRYPVLYWFHGYSGRHNRAEREGAAYDQGEGNSIEQYVSTHPLIVVKVDGFNPRKPGDDAYPRPYNIGPVETHRQFPHYFPELVEFIDANYRTMAERGKRGVAGYSMGGFMALWIAGKHPSLLCSATAVMPSTEFAVGLRGLETEYRHSEVWQNYGGVRLRLVLGKRDFIRSYHGDLLEVWKHAIPNLDVDEFDVEHSVPAIGRTLDFHLRTFADPPLQPVTWSHADVFPNFSKWDWDVASDRRVPGFTVIQDASRTGFRSYVREWLPDGAVMADVMLSVTTARYYSPNSMQTVSVLRTRDGNLTKTRIKADADGRLTIEVPGEECHVGVSAGALRAMDSPRVAMFYWAQINRPIKLAVKVWNKGATRLPASKLAWSSMGITIGTPSVAIPALAPGASFDVPLEFTSADATRRYAMIQADWGGDRFAVGVPIYPSAELSREAVLADGKAVTSFQRVAEKEELVFGEGNGDGRPARDETFAVLLPDGDGFRPAELITADPCLDTSGRLSDPWRDWDHVGGSAKYTLARFREQCQSGRVVRALARVQVPAEKPAHAWRHAIVEIPVP